MLAGWVHSLGPWSWLVLAAILLVAEILMPGIFLIWIGIAAAIVGLLSLALWNYGFWSWEVQLLVFAAVAVIAVLAGRRYLKSEAATDQPNLNDRVGGLVGRTATLREPMREGRGRVHIDDTVWVAEGPDAEAGERVRIVAAKANVLTVERL